MNKLIRDCVAYQENVLYLTMVYYYVKKANPVRYKLHCTLFIKMTFSVLSRRHTTYSSFDLFMFPFHFLLPPTPPHKDGILNRTNTLDSTDMVTWGPGVYHWVYQDPAASVQVRPKCMAGPYSNVSCVPSGQY